MMNLNAEGPGQYLLTGIEAEGIFPLTSPYAPHDLANGDKGKHSDEEAALCDRAGVVRMPISSITEIGGSGSKSSIRRGIGWIRTRQNRIMKGMTIYANLHIF